MLDENAAEVALTAPKVRILLALLLVNRGRQVSADRIASALWGDEPPRSAANLVQGYVRDLRRRIGTAGVVTIRGGYRLDVPRESVDAECFEELVRARRYGEALALWHGSALVEWAEQPWARAVAIRLEEQRLAALESRLAQDIDAGLSSAVIAELTALVDQHPFRERLRVLLIKALYATGRQAEALQAYAHARRCLIDELGLEPGPELRATEAAVLAHDPTLDARPARPGAAPPVPATPLTGRIRTRHHSLRVDGCPACDPVRTRWSWQVQARGRGRLTVVPTGWCGVVRESWAGLGHRCGDDRGSGTPARRGTWSRNRSHLRLPVSAPRHARSGHVRARRRRVVAELATELLARCRDLRILATTREVLRAPGEHVVQLSGLDDAAGAELFQDRARAVNPTVVFDDDSVPAIVRKVEGLPLALELAAARIASLSLDQLVTGLAEPLDLLAGDARAADPRHRTMRAVIAWSHDLLDLRDRAAFAALSVFVAAFDREAAGAIVGDSGPDAVDRLLGRSLLARDRDVGARARFRFLDPVRHFAQEQLTPALLDQVRTRHLAYHVRLAAQVDDHIRTHDATAWTTIARASADDPRAAAKYAIVERSAIAGRFVSDLYWPWFLGGHLAELRSWANATLSAERDARVQARLLRVLASTALAQGDTTVAVARTVNSTPRKPCRTRSLPPLRKTCWVWPPGHAATTPPLAPTTGPPSVSPASPTGRGPSL